MTVRPQYSERADGHSSKPHVTAIVGSGPAGLACAYFLGLLGRESVIYEANRVAGGLLATGIPPFRLPRDVLQQRIDRIVASGSTLRLSTRITHADELKRTGFGYVFIAGGAQAARRLEIEGECLHGVMDALEYLEDFCLEHGRISTGGRDVAVIGGGHTAFDAARAAVRAGASSVTIYYRRTVEEMSAYQEEIRDAVTEGVKIVPLSLPVSFCGSDGSLVGARMTRMELSSPDSEGRRKAVARPHDRFEVACDLAITAIGQQLPDQPLVSCFPRSSWGGVKADYQTGATALERVYAGGDCVLGASSVLRAIDSGRRAALAIDRRLGGSGILPPELDKSIQRPFGLFNP